MLATIPTKKNDKPRNWTVIALICVIVILVGAITGLGAMYYSQMSVPQVIYVNQTPNNTDSSSSNIAQESSKLNTSTSNSSKNTNTVSNQRSTTNRVTNQKSTISNNNKTS